MSNTPLFQYSRFTKRDVTLPPNTVAAVTGAINHTTIATYVKLNDVDSSEHVSDVYKYLTTYDKQYAILLICLCYITYISFTSPLYLWY